MVKWQDLERVSDGKVSKGSCIPLDQGCQVDRSRHYIEKGEGRMIGERRGGMMPAAIFEEEEEENKSKASQ